MSDFKSGSVVQKQDPQTVEREWAFFVLKQKVMKREILLMSLTEKMRQIKPEVNFPKQKRRIASGKC